MKSVSPAADISGALWQAMEITKITFVNKQKCNNWGRGVPSISKAKALYQFAPSSGGISFVSLGLSAALFSYEHW